MVVAAVGKRNVLTADMVKPGAVVIDVGMNRNDEGKLCGDVDFAGVQRSGGLDHAGARRRRADDPRHAAGQHAGSGRARRQHPARSVHPSGRSAQCPHGPCNRPRCRKMSGMSQSPPRLHRPPPVRPGPARSTSRPPWTACWPRPTTALETVTQPEFPSRLERHRQGAGHRHRRAQPRLGRGRATSTAWPTRPNCAPPTTRPCRRSPTSGPAWARTSGCTPSTRPSTPATLNAEQRQAHKNAIRNFVLGGAELHGRRQGALRRHPGAPGRAEPEVQRERARRHRRLRLLRRRGRTRRRAAGRGPGRARRRRRRKARTATSSR